MPIKPVANHLPALPFPQNNQASYWLVGETTRLILEEAKQRPKRLLPYALNPDEYHLIGACLTAQEAQEFANDYMGKCPVEGLVVFVYQRWAGVKDRMNIMIHDKLWLTVMSLRPPPKPITQGGPTP